MKQGEAFFPEINDGVLSAVLFYLEGQRHYTNQTQDGTSKWREPIRVCGTQVKEPVKANKRINGQSFNQTRI